MKYIMLAFCFLALSSCARKARVWVITETQDGGVIGYDMKNSSNEEWKAMMKAIMRCPDTAVMVSDTVKASQYTYNGMQSVDTNTQGSIRSPSGRNTAYYNEQSSTMVPVSHTGTKSWREFTYTCPK